MMQYELKLTNFEGPLDLLLHLISRAKIEPKDIFVSEITEQYLSYMDEDVLADLDAASEFLQMAATLLFIKSRSLLPRIKEELEEELSPEDQLIQRLHEYKKYKEAAKELKQLEEEYKEQFFKLPEEMVTEEPIEPVLVGADITLLFTAYQKLLEQAKEIEEMPPQDVVVYRDEYSMRGQRRLILRQLREKKEVLFHELFSLQPSRQEIVTTFAALLELISKEQAGVTQHKLFGEIAIYHKQEVKYGT
ncbi:MAG: segregation and condensation protein A [Christensenellaceae bacterium]|jgi:segregation and condensation protein A